MLWFIGARVETWLKGDININFLTMMFGSLILAAATQDIAVDGWALTLLSPPNLSYASTAQTIGLGIGSALAFTVFLALNSVDFANRYFRSVPADVPLVTLGPYMKFWGLIYLVVTVWLVFFKTEDPVSATDPDLDVKKVYRVMWSIVSLKSESCLPLCCISARLADATRHPILPFHSPHRQIWLPGQRIRDAAQVAREGSLARGPRRRVLARLSRADDRRLAGRQVVSPLPVK